jgi:pimeloyl-ACP methyl ester carboxylesterase
VFFEAANHWLYLEEPEKFNDLLLRFLRDGLPGVRGTTHV